MHVLFSAPGLQVVVGAAVQVNETKEVASQVVLQALSVVGPARMPVSYPPALLHRHS